MTTPEFNLAGCWLVNVIGPNGYSIPVYVNYHSSPEDIIDLCLQNDMFDDAIDSEYAYAEQMTDYDYEHFKTSIQVLAM